MASGKLTAKINTRFDTVKKRWLFLLFVTLAVCAAGTGAAALLSYFIHWGISSVLFAEGIVIFILGIFLSLGNDPSPINFRGMGEKNAQYISYQDAEATKAERASGAYYKKFNRGGSLFNLGYGNLTMLISGILLVILCFIIYRF